MTLLKATVDSVLVLQAPVYYLNIFCINFVMKLYKLNCSLYFFLFSLISSFSELIDSIEVYCLLRSLEHLRIDCDIMQLMIAIYLPA